MLIANNKKVSTYNKFAKDWLLASMESLTKENLPSYLYTPVRVGTPGKIHSLVVDRFLKSLASPETIIYV